MREFLQFSCGMPLRMALAMLSMMGFLFTRGNAQKIQRPMEHKMAVSSDQVLSVAFSPNGELVAGAGFDKAIKIWNPCTGELRSMLIGPTRTTRDVAFSPDSKSLAAGGDDQTVRLYDARTAELKWELPKLGGEVYSVAFSPDGGTLAIAIGETADAGRHWTGEVKFLDPRTGKIKSSRRIAEGMASSIAFSHDGKTLATAEREIKLWDVQTGMLLRTLAPDRGAVSRVVFSGDGKTLASAGGYTVAFGGGTQLMSEAHLWDYRTGKLRHKLTAMNPWLRSVAFSPDGKVLATGSSGPIRRTGNETRVTSEMKLWDARTGELLRTVEGPLGEVWSIAFSPDGKTLLTCDIERMALIDSQTGETKHTLARTRTTFGP